MSARVFQEQQERNDMLLRKVKSKHESDTQAWEAVKTQLQETITAAESTVAAMEQEAKVKEKKAKLLAQQVSRCTFVDFSRDGTLSAGCSILWGWNAGSGAARGNG